MGPQSQKFKLKENKISYSFAHMSFVGYCYFVESQMHSRYTPILELHYAGGISSLSFLHKSQHFAKCCSCFLLHIISWMHFLLSIFATKLIIQIPTICHLSYCNIFPSALALFLPHLSKFYDLETLCLTVAGTALIHSLIRPL